MRTAPSCANSTRAAAAGPTSVLASACCRARSWPPAFLMPSPSRGCPAIPARQPRPSRALPHPLPAMPRLPSGRLPQAPPGQEPPVPPAYGPAVGRVHQPPPAHQAPLLSPPLEGICIRQPARLARAPPAQRARRRLRSLLCPPLARMAAGSPRPLPWRRRRLAECRRQPPVLSPPKEGIYLTAAPPLQRRSTADPQSQQTPPQPQQHSRPQPCPSLGQAAASWRSCKRSSRRCSQPLTGSRLSHPLTPRRTLLPTPRAAY